MKPSAEAESPDELMDRVCALTDSERRYALNWLAAAGGGAPDGQAVLRALAAVSLYRERLAAVSRVHLWPSGQPITMESRCTQCGITWDAHYRKPDCQPAERLAAVRGAGA